MSVALVGCGRMGRAHLAALDECGSLGSAVTTVVDPALARGERFADRPMVPLADVLADEQITSLLIATPTATHEPLVAAALRAGKHVLCEKPLTLKPDSSRRLAEVASAAGRTLQVGYWRRFCRAYARALQLLQSDDAASLRSLHCAQWDAAPPPPEFCEPTMSGGLEVDCGVHEVDLALWLLGEPIVAVTASGAPPSHAMAEVDDIDSVQALCRTRSGRVVTIDLTRVAGGDDSIRTELMGARGSAVVEFAATGHLTARPAPGDRHEEELIGDVIADALRLQFASFLSASATGATRSHDGMTPFERPDGHSDARAVEACQAIRRSRLNRQWEQIGA